MHKARHRNSESFPGMILDVVDSEPFSLVSVCVAGARDFPADEFEQQTAAAYQAIQQSLAAGPCPFPVRVWNHLPEIHAPGPDGIDRYMAFNAGRFHAYSQWLGGAGAFDRTVPSTRRLATIGLIW